MGKAFNIVSQTRVYDGHFKMDRFALTHSLHGGGMSDVIVREIFQRGHAAALLVYDPKLDSLLLIEEFRPGIMAAGYDAPDCWAPGPIAGVIDAGETPLQAAVREAQEEAGITPATLITMHGPLVILPSPGGCSETLNLFICEASLAGYEGGVFGMTGEGEDIRPRLVPREEALNLLTSANAMVGNTATLLLWLERLLATGKIERAV